MTSEGRRPGLVTVLLGVLCLMPLLLFSAFAVYQRAETLREGKTDVVRTIQIFEEHALRVFESQQLIIDRTDQYLGDTSWSDIRTSEDVHLFLQRAAAASPHVDGLWLVPPDGRTANSADFFPVPDISVTDRKYFQALSRRDQLHYGEMIVGRAKGNVNFNLSRRRSPRDTFNGVILVTSSLQYFTDFWEQATQGSFVAGIFREDGEILVRYPVLDGLPPRLGPESPLLGRLRENDDGVYPSVSSLDARERVYGYSRIGATPLFIGYGVVYQDVLAGWRNEMLRLGLVALMASALLAVAAGMILRQTRSLRTTAVSWRQTAEELEREVDRRLRAEDVAAERKRLLDEVRTLTAQRQSILENMVEGVLALDARGCIIYANREAMNLLGPLLPGGQEFAALVDARRILALDGSDLETADAPHRAPLDGADVVEREYLVRREDGSEAICSFRGGPIVGAQGQPEGAVLTFWDVTERKREVERKALLMQELDHRVRNMLATIMAMVRISNEPRQSKKAFVEALTGRVGAMARTHGVLSEGQWKGATIGRLVDDEVASAADARQLVLKGDRNLVLPPKDAADLALALHELATNALKHGAWSVPKGIVELHWWRDVSAGSPVLCIRWKETGGPRIANAPERRGFGSVLLQAIFAGREGMSMKFRPEGLECTMSVPILKERTARTADEMASATEHADAAGPSLQQVRVLVVEDEALVRLDLLEILRDAGAMVVAEANSLSEALEKAGSTAFDVAILDKNLNGESSLPVARLLSERGAAIIFVSGYRGTGSGIGGAEDTEHIHLQKPISPQALVTSIASVVASRAGRG